MNWTHLTDVNQLDDIDALSKNQPILIFKHSTRCSVSDIAYSRMYNPKSTLSGLHELPAFYLDLFQFRSLSNLVSEKYKVFHESPQILLIKDGECFFDCSHLDIDQIIILEQLESEQSNSKFLAYLTLEP